MTRRRVLVKKLLADLFAFGMLHCVLTFLTVGILGRPGFVVPSLALLLPFGAMFLVRLKIRSLALFLLAHAGLACASLALPLERMLQLWLLPFGVLLALYSFRERLAGDWRIETIHLSFAAGINAAMVMAAAFLGFGTIAPALTLWSGILLLCALLHIQMTGLEEALLVQAASSSRPLGSVLRFNNRIIAAFLALSAAAAWVAGRFSLEELAKGIVRGLLLAVLWLLEFIGRFLSAPEEAETAPAVGEPPVAAGGPAEGFWLFELLEKLVYFLMQALVIGGLAALVLYAAYRIYRAFYAEGDENGDIKEFIGPRMDGEKLTNTVWGLRRRLLFGRDGREQVRRRYYRRVRRHMRGGVEVRAQDTPGEIAGKVRPRENLDALTGEYERARYGPE